MRGISRLLAIVCITAPAIMHTAPASATLYCNLKPTKDGFVALRAGPNPSARLIARMTAKDEVLIGLGEKGKWVEVTWYRGMSRHDGAHGVHGWAHTAFIDDTGG